MTKIALLCNINKNNTEQEIEFDSPLTIEKLTTSIETKYNLKLIECDTNIVHWINELINFQPDLVFNIAEGYYGEAREAFYPTLLEQLKVIYTGPSPTELLICHNKAFTKRLLLNSNVLFPFSIVINTFDDLLKKKNKLNNKYPFIIKLNTEGSSIGMDENAIVYDWNELEIQFKKVLNLYDTNILIEEYIEGRDLSITYIEDLGIFGPVEYTYPNSKIYDFNLKGFENHLVDVVKPNDLHNDINNNLYIISQIIIDTLDIKSYCRIDYRLNKEDKIFLLEVNGQVSFHPNGAFVLAAYPKYSFDDIVHHIIKFSLENKRYPSKIG